MRAELLKSQASSSNRRRSTDLLVRGAKPFTQWIDGAPKEKLSLLYDTDGRRYGIETTNHAECYNMVMRRVRGFSLVCIVEFIMYGCVRYFRERYASAASLLHDPGVRFCRWVNEYMKKKMENARFHSVISMGTNEQIFEVLCRDRTDRVSADKG